MPLLGELSRTSLDLVELDSDSTKSLDVRLNSPKSGIYIFCHFWANWAERPGIWSNRIPIRPNPGTFGLIRPKVAFEFFAFFRFRSAPRIRRITDATPYPRSGFRGGSGGAGAPPPVRPFLKKNRKKRKNKTGTLQDRYWKLRLSNFFRLTWNFF